MWLLPTPTMEREVPERPSTLTYCLCCCLSGVPGAAPGPGTVLNSVSNNTAALSALWPALGQGFL